MAARIHLKKKDGVEYDKIEGLVKIGGGLNRASFLNKAGEQLDTFSASMNVSSLDVPGENVEKFIDGEGVNYKTASWEYDANAKETTGKWLD